MICALLLTAFLAPQEPIAESIQEQHRTHGVSADVRAALRAISDVKEGAIKGVHTPYFTSLLRKKGVGSLDAVHQVMRLQSPQSHPLELFELAARLDKGKNAKYRKVEKQDLKSIQRTLAHSFRDLRSALGSGRNLREVAPRVQSAVNYIGRNQNLDNTTAEELATLEDRLYRARTVDQEEIYEIAQHLVLSAMALERPDLEKKWRKMKTKKAQSLNSLEVEGEVLVDRQMDFGRLVIGGYGRNVYDCDAIEVIIDLGGDDEYKGAAGGAGELRRLAMVLDLEGDDRYQGLNNALGSATFGIGILIDLAGNDQYEAADRSAGFGTAGVGVFIDRAGDDQYALGMQSGGVGLAGKGLFFDLGGDDVQAAGSQSFGFGLPGGLGMFVDWRGDDVRTLGSKPSQVTSRADEVSLGFGVGMGLNAKLSGGLGVHFDAQGDDSYRGKGITCGAGVRTGAGVFVDLKGSDTYRLGFASLGAAYLQGIGVCMDRDGDDSYEAMSLSLGAASHAGMAWFLDSYGDDSYAMVAPGLGDALSGALSGFLDQDGEDRYHKVRLEAEWELRVAGETQQKAVGLFLDQGGKADKFDYRRTSAPADGTVRVLASGIEGVLSTMILVDR